MTLEKFYEVAMKPGTLVEVKGRGRATVVYSHLDGYGIVWGKRNIDPDDLPEPEAMLRNTYPGADLECVGEDFTIL